MINYSLPSLNDQAVFNESFSAKNSDTTTLVRKNQPVKRLFDIFVSGLVIVSLLIWLFPLIGFIIRLTSPGPILFIQLRTGRNGKPFRCLKFRTMTYDRNAEFRQATKNDNRVTRIGRFLRKSNLDELPQVFNVLFGDMSIVGPRPHAIQHDAEYWDTMEGYASRYIVKPGITGLAQVRGCRGETSKARFMKQRVRLDHLYISKQSTLLDLKICLWTVGIMIKGDKKAY